MMRDEILERAFKNSACVCFIFRHYSCLLLPHPPTTKHLPVLRCVCGVVYASVLLLEHRTLDDKVYKELKNIFITPRDRVESTSNGRTVLCVHKLLHK